MAQPRLASAFGAMKQFLGALCLSSYWSASPTTTKHFAGIRKMATPLALVVFLNRGQVCESIEVRVWWVRPVLWCSQQSCCLQCGDSAEVPVWVPDVSLPVQLGRVRGRIFHLLIHSTVRTSRMGSDWSWSLKVHLELLCEKTGAQTVIIYCCLRCISRELNQKPVSQELDWHSDTQNHQSKRLA